MAKILVVDDSELARNLIGDVLAKAGHAVRTASGGSEALDILADGAYDLLVTDWVMPGMMGEELVRKVREKHPGLPVVIITSYYDSELLTREEVPGDGVVRKPFKNETLLDMVDKLAQPPRK
jgi:two-component system cell cycle sensor histidine kinase/response regulator CckA